MGRRKLQHRIGREARPRAIPISVERLERRCLLATLTVANTDDAGVGSLRAAIERANLDPARDTIVFDPAASGAIALSIALPDLAADVALIGPGSSKLTVARSVAAGTPEFRIFTVSAGTEVEISGLTVRGGRATRGGGIFNGGKLVVTDSAIEGNAAADSVGGLGLGGGVFNSVLGTLTITASTIGGNSADGGGGIDNSGALTIAASSIRGNSAPNLGSGGGIRNSGTLTLVDSSIRANSTVVAGGGIINLDSGVLAVTRSTISGNSTEFLGGAGGGIFNLGTMVITESTLSGNEATYGGGIATRGTSKITGSTLNENSARGFPNNEAQGYGGGISNDGTLTVIASTFSGNSARGEGIGSITGGGGISNRGSATVEASTFSGNLSSNGSAILVVASPTDGRLVGRLTLGTSILAGAAGSTLANQRGTVASAGRNLFSDSPGLPLDPTDLINANPLLGPLADNGGPTSTHALLPGSPAIDAGTSVAGVATDQRGIIRPQGAAPDIGSYESRGFSLAVVGGDAQSTPANSLFPAPLVVSVTSPFGEPVAGGVVTFSAPPGGPSADLGGLSATIGTNSLARVNASANGAAGSYPVSARASGSPAVSLTLTNTNVTPVIDPPTPPTVAGLRRVGFHLRPTRLVLTFNEPLAPALVGNLANYRITVPGADGRLGTRDDVRVAVRSASYDATALTVTLTPARRLNIHRRFRLTVRGTSPGGLTDATGILLDGDRDGRPGGDYRASMKGFGAAAQTLRAALTPRVGTGDRAKSPASRGT